MEIALILLACVLIGVAGYLLLTRKPAVVEEEHWIEIEGVVECPIVETEPVRITLHAEVYGDVTAPKVYVAGTVEGTIEADEIEIARTGCIIGGVKTRHLFIVKGGQFTGSSILHG